MRKTEQTSKPPEAPKPKTRTMALAAIIVVILVVVGIGVYILTRPTGPTVGENITIWDGKPTCLQTASPPDCGFKDSSGSPNVTIAVGTTVQWTNDGGAPHTVTSCDPSHSSDSMGCPTANDSSLPSFDSSTIAQNGGTYIHTFSQAGTYYYYCTIHAWMHGKIVVTAAQ